MSPFRGVLLNIILSIPAVIIAFTAQGYEMVVYEENG
jgi:hypothetical protein